VRDDSGGELGRRQLGGLDVDVRVDEAWHQVPAARVHAVAA
jgi:hypothetical protein